MKTQKLLFATLVTAGVLCACTPAGTSTENAGTLCQFDNVQATRLAHVTAIDSAAEGAFCSDYYADLRVQALWPQTINGKPCPALQQALLQAMLDTTCADLDGAIALLLNDPEIIPATDDKSWKVEPLDSIPTDTSLTMSSSSRLRLLDNNAHLFTFEVTGESYLGGAHGVCYTHYVTYDATQDKVLALNDLVADTTLFKHIVRQSLEGDPNIEVDYLFLPADGEPPLPSQFYIDKDGNLHAFYQVYEIGPYAAGSIDAIIYPIAMDDQEKSVFTPYGKRLLGL